MVFTEENKFNIARVFQEFDKENVIKQIILIAENGKVKNIEIDNNFEEES